jgi:hypothetical protein
MDTFEHISAKNTMLALQVGGRGGGRGVGHRDAVGAITAADAEDHRVAVAWFRYWLGIAAAVWFGSLLRRWDLCGSF